MRVMCIYISKSKICVSYACILFDSQGYYVTYWLAAKPVFIADSLPVSQCSDNTVQYEKHDNENW